MRVKLCARCPYTPRDLAHHYDPEAALHACAKCDNELDLYEPRRQKCSTEIETTSAAQSSVAPFARESSASSAITAREPRSAPRNASTSSGHDATTTQDGCGACARPDGIGRGNNAARFALPLSLPLSLPLASIDPETAC